MRKIMLVDGESQATDTLNTPLANTLAVPFMSSLWNGDWGVDFALMRLSIISMATHRITTKTTSL